MTFGETGFVDFGLWTCEAGNQRIMMYVRDICGFLADDVWLDRICGFRLGRGQPKIVYMKFVDFWLMTFGWTGFVDLGLCICG
jgi:uncharacterized cupin superfamily protein